MLSQTVPYGGGGARCFMIKTLGKLGIEGNFLKMIKGVYEKAHN